MLYLRKRKRKTMKNRYITLLFTIALMAAMALQPARADNARVSLLTCSPGNEVYELFGHTALRYSNPDRGIDAVFNYGYFSFSAPNFVWRFILGETDYMVGAVDYDSFIAEYSMRGSGVTEQVIQLDSVQKEQLFNALAINCQLKNRVYRYNYFYNNCTTKIRDRIFEQFAPTDSVAYNNDMQASTIREALSQYTNVQPWSEFGINMLLGADVDAPATREVLQFLPCYLMNDFATAQISGTDGTMPLVSEQQELLLPTEREKSINHLTPFNCALLLLLFTMIIMLCEVRSGRIFWLYDILLYGVQGVAGVILLFMATCSLHPAVDNNYLLILLNPLPLLLIPIHIYCCIKRKHPAYMWAPVAMVAIFIATAPFVPQYYPAPVFIFAITIVVRSIFHIYRKRICELSLY